MHYSSQKLNNKSPLWNAPRRWLWRVRMRAISLRLTWLELRLRWQQRDG